jgi:DNA polymerase III subunit delta'
MTEIFLLGVEPSFFDCKLYLKGCFSYNISMKKYNWQTIGHQKTVKFLQKSIDNNKLAHAYLFSGKQNLGKRLLVNEFVDSILCHDHNKAEGDVLPCRTCVYCDQLKKGIHPDVYFLKKEEDKKNITVEQVREMQKMLYLASFLNSYKFAIIEHAEDMSESAQNAILKILEEPKPKTILILLISDLNLLLPTIVSRCQSIKFYPLSEEKIFHHLTSLGANREEAKVFTSLSHGQIGTAVSFFKNKEIYQEYLKDINEFFVILDSSMNQKFKVLDKLLANFKDNLEKNNYLNSELDSWSLILRDILLIKNNTGHLIVNRHFQKQLESMAQKYSVKKLLSGMTNIRQVKKYLQYNINPRLAVENLILNF